MPFYNDICYQAQLAGATLLQSVGLVNIPEDHIHPGLTDQPADDPQVVVYCLKMIASPNNNYEGLWAGKLHFEVQSLRDGTFNDEPVTPTLHHLRAGEVFSWLMTGTTVNNLSDVLSDFTVQEAAPAEQGWFIHKERNAWVSYLILDLDGCCGRDITIT